MSGISAERTDVRQYVEAGKLAFYENDQWHVVLKAGPESSVQLFLLGHSNRLIANVIASITRRTR